MDFREIEQKYQQEWIKKGVYNYRENDHKAEKFVIDTPPPTISGNLHMGHVFSYCHTDFIARFERMRGKNVFYPIGFDNNGLPTERLVEKVYNVRARDLPLMEFSRLCQDLSAKSIEDFKVLFNRLALSFDWNQAYASIDERCRYISQSSFVDLYHKGLVYRKLQPGFWDPVDFTAIAQAEIEYKELDAEMHYFYFTNQRQERFAVASTRPGLLPACVAVFYHPQDERFSCLKDQELNVPIFNFNVPVIADEGVDPQKGTGLVMCCTFGDEKDVMWQQKYDLPIRQVLGRNGKINGDFLGSVNDIFDLSVNKATEVLVSMLKAQNLWIESRRIKHQVKCAERSGKPVEIIATRQWFVKITQYKEILREAANKCIWHPPEMQAKMMSWIDAINWDWCISRQRYFGVPFPVWYDENNEVVLAQDLPTDPREVSINGLTPETDVMDTWATSSLTPQISARGLNAEFSLSGYQSQLFPADLRPQSHEIIRTWAFYTLVKSCHHTSTSVPPWTQLMISGWCLSEDRTKMSKSKGNIISPVSILDKYGSDVVRYWASNANIGADTVVSDNIFKIGHKLVNKLYNVARLAHTLTDAESIDLEKLGGQVTHALDKWLLYKLNNVIIQATEKLSQLNYFSAMNVIKTFFWEDFCDNYLELIKGRVYQKLSGYASALSTLNYSFIAILKLLAPFLPFITEELYHHYKFNDSIHQSGKWPAELDLPIESTEQAENCLKVLSEVRKEKANRKFSVKAPLDKVVISCRDGFLVDPLIISDLKLTINAASIEFKALYDSRNEDFTIDYYFEE